MMTATRARTMIGPRVRSGRVPEGRCWVRLSSPIPGLARGDGLVDAPSGDGSQAVGGGSGGGRSGGGALALIEITGDVEAILSQAGIKPVSVGAVALRNLMNEDEGLVARWSVRAATLMPHGSPIVVQRLLRRLSDVCGELNGSLSDHADGDDDAPKREDWAERFPAARSLLEARMLWALSNVQSPLAVDVLLNQPTLWRTALGRDEGADEEVERTIGTVVEADRHRRLARLLNPATIAAAGWANIGKSSLLNALSGREVSLVADIAGTTRDHVGAALVIDGLMVRWLDLPGLSVDETPVDALAREAEVMALSAARHADLVLSCASAGGATHGVLADPPEPARLGVEPGRVLRVALRADLAPVEFQHDHRVSVRDLESVRALARACRTWLVSDEDLHWASAVGPWRFWEEIEPGSGPCADQGPNGQAKGKEFA